MTISYDELLQIRKEVGTIFNKHKLSLSDGIYVLDKLKESVMMDLLDGVTEIS
jgi:hypothetical protein